MNIYVDTISPKNNFISYNSYSWKSIIPLSINQYLFKSRENIYFLLLSFVQLLTFSKINILPSNWSPTGPFSTLIPFILCYIIELVSLIIKYLKDLIKTYKINFYNQIDYVYLDKIKRKNLKDIKIGDLIVINKNQRVPVDGIILNVDNDTYAKINIANLNGECDILCKNTVSDLFTKCKLRNIHLVNIKDFSNSIKNFSADLIANNQKFTIDDNYFVPGGSVNYGNDFILIVTQIGKNTRAFTSNKTERLHDINFTDCKLTELLITFFLPLLIFLTLLMVYISVRLETSITVYLVTKKIVQSWILLNGIMPFSVKIITIFNKNIQSYLYSNKCIEYTNSNAIDNFYNIDHIICDKTGTITKNELCLTHVSYENTIYVKDDINHIDFKLLSLLLLGLHHKNKNFCTEEDKVISERIISLGAIIEYSNNNVIVIKNNDILKSTILEKDKLQFDNTRKLSSVIFTIKENNKTYIITKGPIHKIKSLIKDDNINSINKVTELYNKNYPYLRTIAFAIREIDYDKNIDPTKYEESDNFNFLSILGIQDEIQEGVFKTIQYLKNNNKKISICTGDRAETALYISKKIGLLSENTISYKSDLVLSDDRLKSTTLLLNSTSIQNALINYNNLIHLKKYIINSNNLVCYSLIPKDKKFITNIFEGNKINCITIGDGTNDIPMLTNSTLGIGLKNNNNMNVCSVTHITISKFSNLLSVYNNSFVFNLINFQSIYGIFFKTLFINLIVCFYILYNNSKILDPLFNFIEIQGFHIIWGLLPIMGLNLMDINLVKKLYTLNDIFYLVKLGLYNALKYIIFIFIFYHYCLQYYMDIKKYILILSILVINIEFLIKYGIVHLNILFTILSVCLGLLYVLSFRNIIPNIF